MKCEPTLYIIDGSAGIYRAYHAIRSLSTSKGFPTNAIYGFIAMLVKIFREYRPTHLCVAYDAKGPTFRHDMYEQYKATRPGMPDDLIVQLPYVKKIVAGLGVHALEMEGYEADDIIGSVAKGASGRGVRTVIVSGDKDFCQLVDDHITLFEPGSNKTLGVEDVRELFGVDPAQVIEVLGLAGDASDNVPGVAGIGRKTAVKLIQRYHSIENIYAHLDEVVPANVRDKLTEGHDNARLSKDLVTIDTKVPVSFDLEQLRVSEPDVETLEPLFRELEFTRFIREFSAQKVTPQKSFTLVQDEEELGRVVEQTRSAASFAFVLNTSPSPLLGEKLIGFAVSLEPHQAYYVPCYETPPSRLAAGTAYKALELLLEDEGIKKVGHDTKRDFVVLNQHGMHLRGIDGDVMIASYVLNPSKKNHSLENSALEFLGRQLPALERPIRARKKGDQAEEIQQTDEWQAICEQADAIGQLATVLLPRLKENNLDELFYEIELPLANILARMELVGIKVNEGALSDMSREIGNLLKDLEKRIHSLAGEEFNINSPQQLGRILFEKLNLPVVSRTKTGYSTSVAVLTNLATVHEMPSLILEYRRFSKLKSTYIDVLPRLINPETKRVHTTFNQTITATGRLSSSDPNLQNIPIRGAWGKEIRQAFVAGPGMTLVAADYSQIELRIVAHLSGDQNLREAFVADQDIHTRTAAELFQVAAEEVTPAMRRQAKVVNFGVIYGMSHRGLAQELGISMAEARQYIDTYFKRYQGVNQYIQRTLENAREKGSVTTLFGRIRYVPEITSRNRMAREAAERIAINTPIQGTAADIIKIAMIEIDKRLAQEQIDGRMILQIHDELVLEVSKEDCDALMSLVKNGMERAITLDVPLRATIKSGENWDEAHG